MNEQKLADLFSAQIDQMLQGRPIAAPAAAADLAELLSLGQSLTQLQFQASPAAQAAFQGQLLAWSKESGAALFSALGEGARFLLSSLLIIATVVSGVGLGFVLTNMVLINVAGSKSDRPGPIITPVLEQAPVLDEDRGALPLPVTTLPAPVQTPTPAKTASPSPTLRDIIPQATTSLEDRLTLPTSTPIPMVTPTLTRMPTVSSNVDGNPADPAGETGNPESGDHDRGHGNDPDHLDEDNPGKSNNPPGGGDSGGGKGGDKGGGKGK